ncbi:hypothetical protein PR048_012317 [Dryococelus australis]|uniref:Uncharacterized protein n=1 Tax=Dryococelus australis TaxID=614101 RepID=A0ABQ9HP11_9NEOP|nr:hypothetical protein PR048_012317 [Dryococelus australis]
MQSLQLIALDIQGFHQDSHNNNASLPSSTARSQGKYLNLQHIKILGNPNLGNRPAPVIQIAEAMKMFSNNIPLGTWSKEISVMQNNQHPNDIQAQLVILQPAVTKVNEEILPYKVYKDEQERAGMSVFSTLSNLLFLRVHSCGLKEVNWEMFTGLSKLQYLSLEKNNLLFIPDFTFYSTTNLKTLSLAHNKLLSLHSTGLAGLLDLENLDLSYNNFSHLSELSLPPFPKLQKADFRGNPIQEVFASTFEIMNATHELVVLGEQSPDRAAMNIFGNIPAKVIRLTGNMWECSCAMRDWKPAAINGRKQHAQELCQFQYDKGSACSQLTEQYVYDRTMAPRCATPIKYKNWSVFTALRKQLHCDINKHPSSTGKNTLRKNMKSTRKA